MIAEPIAGIDNAITLGHRIVAAISEPLVFDGKVAKIGASVGVALYQDGRESALDLLQDADQGVYRAKVAGRGRVEVFDEGLRRELAERNEIGQALRHGLEDGELRLHYQPIIDGASGELDGLEALVRWERPGHGLVPPAAFIPVAESCDLAVDLGRWVLSAATSQLAAWSNIPAIASAHVAVNISARHLLNASIVDDVDGALSAACLDPSRLVIEITETTLLTDVEVAIEHLSQLRRLGVRVAIDDFGTGYTSIGRLGELPVDVLKIDRSFVGNLHRYQDGALVELMVEVAHTLGLGVVAEGVEAPAQLNALRQLACDDVQGFLIAKPFPPSEVADWATTLPRAVTPCLHH